MALVKIYDADGVEFQKESVDARECVETGEFTYEIIEKQVKPKVKEKEKEVVVEKKQAAPAPTQAPIVEKEVNLVAPSKTI